MDVGKDLKSGPCSISILARDCDYHLLILANHTLPFIFTHIITIFCQREKNSSPISVFAKVVYGYLQFLKLIISIESFWRQLVQLIIGQVTEKENMT